MTVESGSLQNQIDSFYSSVKAQALLIALEWAGESPGLLSRITGGCASSGVVWVRRNEIPPKAAYILSRIDGFPLTAREMRPDVDWTRFTRLICPHCVRKINPPKYQSGCRVPRQDSKKAHDLMAEREQRVRRIAERGTTKRTTDEYAAAARLGTERKRAAKAEAARKVVYMPRAGWRYVGA